VAPTTVLPKLRLDGFSETPGEIPVPERLTLLVARSETMARVPVRGPAVVGVKVTPTSQLEPTLSTPEVEQVVVVESTLKSPLALKLLKLSAADPVLVKVTLCALLVVPTV
jgi:hypothetical protein